MKIAFFRYSLFNRGGDRLSLAYANYLAETGHDVTLYIRELDTVFDISPALVVERVACRGKAGFLLYALTHDLHHDVVIVDIIHLHLLLSVRNRTIYYAQADDVEYYDSKPMRALVDMLYRIHFKRGYPLISMSQHLTDLFQARYRRTPVYTIRTGIDHGAFYCEPDAELLALKENRKVVVFMARGDAYRKGLDIAMKVFGSIPTDVAEKMELWVCGNHLEQADFDFPVRNLGVVSDATLRRILSSSDIFFYPSRHEGFGLFPLEAMACGCVALTTDAIPYARETPSMVVAPVEDTRALTESLARLVTDGSYLSGLKMLVCHDARAYDFEISKVAFDDALGRIVAGYS